MPSPRRLVLSISLALVGCGGAVPSATGAPTTSTQGATTKPAASATAHTTVSANPCAVAPQAAPPTFSANDATALAFAPDGRLFYAERSGTVLVLQDGASKVFATVATVTSEAGGGYSERGLLGLAISPTFAADRFVYAFYSDPDRAHQQVIRWTDCAGVTTPGAIIVTLPAGDDCCHKGGRIAFGADGMLYITLGEQHSAPAAQDSSDPRGKVLRYKPDGSVPTDNPFGPTNPVWAYGFRNPFGIAFNGAQMAITDNGPSGDAGSPGSGYDVAYLNVTRGEHLQWPDCYGYSHPLAGSCNGTTPPDWSSENSTVVPTGATFVDASGPAPYAGHLVFCTYDSGMLVLTPGTPHAGTSAGPSECRFDVKQGPDHALYYSDSGHIYRLG